MKTSLSSIKYDQIWYKKRTKKQWKKFNREGKKDIKNKICEF